MSRHPPLPFGISPIQFGQDIMKWGRGEEALKRIGTITVEELRLAGIDCSIAKAWRDMYREWSAIHPDNPSAPFRWQLMEHVMVLLECQDK